MSAGPSSVRMARRIAAAIAVVIVFDALWVQAPFLVLLAAPFAITAWRYRQGHLISSIGVIACSSVYALIGVTYALSNGLHSPQEIGQPREVISVGDFAFVYVGSPLAVWLVLHVGASMVRRPAAAASTAAA
jgi:hypothetical protein